MPEDDIHTLAKDVAVLHTEITNLRNEILTRDAFLQKALELQAQEYLRRLDVLNGEHHTLEQMSDSYLPRETFEGYKNTQAVIMEEANKWRNAKEVEIAALKGRVTGSVFILGAAWVLAQAVISWWRTH